MPNREKVMRGLVHHSGEEIPIPCDNCPYDDDEPYCSQRLAADALSLLKEQEKQLKEWEKHVPFLAAHGILKGDEDDA